MNSNNLPSASHPIVSVLSEGIVKEIHETRKAGLFRASLILLYCGIDQVSYLAMPIGQLDATRADFINWTDRYLLLSGSTTITGKELYAARCGLVHKYGTEAKLHRENSTTRQIVHAVGGPRKVFSDVKVPHIVGVEINYLIDRFVAGVIAFTRDVENSPQENQEAVNERLHGMVHMLPVDGS